MMMMVGYRFWFGPSSSSSSLLTSYKCNDYNDNDDVDSLQNQPNHTKKPRYPKDNKRNNKKTRKERIHTYTRIHTDINTCAHKRFIDQKNIQ